MNNILVKQSKHLYSFLLQLYPKHYKQEFGEEMKFVFSETLHDLYEQKGIGGIMTLWTRTIIDGLKSGPREHLENIQSILLNSEGLTPEAKALGGDSMSTKNNDLLSQNKVFLWGALATVVLLLIPFLGRWPWTFFDFIFAGTLLFGTGSAFVLLGRKAKNNSYRLGVGLGILGAMLLIWISGAVGIIGDPEDGTADLPNLLYFGVLAIGFLGSIISRFKPTGMAKTFFAVAIAQMIVPVIMLSLNPHVLSDAPGVFGVFALNGFFAMMFAGSGILFKQASEEKRVR